MVDIQKRKADRLRVMNAIFDAAEGSQHVFVDVLPIMDFLGLTDREMADACSFLAGESLIEEIAEMGNLSPAAVQLTHWGIREIEQSREAPDVPTQHFPPLLSVVQNFYGDVIKSNLQAGTAHSSQTQEARGEAE